jgi:hypothetical protein
MIKKQTHINSNIFSKSLFFWLLVFVFTTGFKANAQVDLKLDTTKIRIGEQIEYIISVDKEGVDDIAFPKLQLDSLKKIEVVKSFDIDSVKNSIFKKYLLTSFDSGRYMIPKQSVLIDNVAHQIDSVFIDVSTVAVDTTKQKLYPIKPIVKEPYTFDDFKIYLWWLLGILLLAALIWYLIRRSKRSPEEKEKVPAIPPFELAKKRLKELDDKHLLEKSRVKQYYVELTDIVRNFIESEMHIPALESTTDELMETIADFNQNSHLDIPKETLQKLKSLLQDADLVKFAKSKPLPNEIDLHRQDAENIIDIMHPKAVNKEKREEDGQ